MLHCFEAISSAACFSVGLLVFFLSGKTGGYWGEVRGWFYASQRGGNIKFKTIFLLSIFTSTYFFVWAVCDSAQPGLPTPNGQMQSAAGLCSIPKKPYKHSSWINFHLRVKVFVPPQSMQRMSLLIIRFGDVGRRPCAPISCILVSTLLRELLHQFPRANS